MNDDIQPRRSASFCVPRAAIEALLTANATAYEICAYLILARFTDATGLYSTASLAALNRYTGANKTKNGPLARALERLKTIRAESVEYVSNGRSGKSHAMVPNATDIGPLLYDRAGWMQKTGEVLNDRDAPSARGAVTFVLEDFGEPLEDRVWFGAGLVDGFGDFKLPLKRIRHGGDAAARLLLKMYAYTDMETWGGVDPRKGPWRRYEPVAEDTLLRGGGRLIRSKRQGSVSKMDARVSGGSDEAWWNALTLLDSCGLFYECVMVLNRDAKKATFSGGAEYGDIPQDAEPLYELDARSHHGFKPEGEEGLAGVTANTAGAIGHAVAIGGQFDGTYAAIVPQGQGAMIAGIFRPRFRVANPKNAGVKNAWARIYDGNHDAQQFIDTIRAANKLELARPVPRRPSTEAEDVETGSSAAATKTTP